MATPRPLPPQSIESDDKSNQSGTSISIDAPAIEDGVLNVGEASIRSVDHAVNICTATELANQARNKRAAVIQAFHDGEPPKNAGAQAEKAKGWETNINTGWLEGNAATLSRRLQRAITQKVYLTKSQLPANVAGHKSKSAVFQELSTKLWRSWPDFGDFVQNVAKETALQGYSYAAWLDVITWRPTFFRQDALYVPEESKQRPSDCQFVVVKYDWQLNEFISLFQDESAASDSGWDVKNCEISANKAVVKNAADDATTTDFRKFADMINQGTLGLTYSAAGPRIVKTWILLNCEYDGKVSFWIIDRDSRKLLRYVHKRYAKMADAMGIFTLDVGNGTIHSSKGIGRKLYNLAKQIEDARSSSFMQVKMGSLTMLQVEEKDRAKMQLSIQGPFMFLPAGVTPAQFKYAVDSAAYNDLDNRLSNWAQQTAGTYISGDPNAPDKTATQASIDAQREQENSDDLRARFDSQFLSQVVQPMQLRAFSDANMRKAAAIFAKVTAGKEEEPLYSTNEDDEEETAAIRCLVQFYKYDLTDADIRYLRNSPASGLAHMDDAIKTNGALQVSQQFGANPNLDQLAILRDSIEAMAGPDAAKRYVLQDIDQTVVAEAARLQMMESSAMMALGAEVPVSPRDVHIIHAKAVQGVLQSIIPSLQSTPQGDPETNKVVELHINHMASHLEFANQAPVKAPELKELGAFLAQFTKDFKSVITIQQQAQLQAQQAQAQQAQQAQVQPVSSAPVQVAPEIAAPVDQAPVQAPVAPVVDVAPLPLA
jgi:hypothetical protein